MKGYPALSEAQAQDISTLARSEEGMRRIQQIAVEPLLTHNNRGRLPERIFRETFLPWATGAVEETPEYPYSSEWIKIAGSPTAEVEVFLESTNEIVFIVPAMWDTSGLGKLGINEIRMIVLDAKHLETTNPGLANRRIAQNLLQHAANLRSSYRTDAIEKWNTILNYYGLAQSSVTAANPTAQADDEFEAY